MEEWRDVIGYNGDYQISNLGRVKSFKYIRERILIPKKKKNGYLQVILSKNNTHKTITIHKLVAIAFLNHSDNSPGHQKIVVDHINNIKDDNRSANLQLLTERQNTIKSSRPNANHTGAQWSIKEKRWRAAIHFKGRKVSLGYFTTEIAAGTAYQKALSEIESGLDLNQVYPKRIKKGSSKHVYWQSRDKKWQVTIKGKYIGQFNTEEEATKIAKQASLPKLENLIASQL